MNAPIRVAPLEAPPSRFRSGREELDEWLRLHGLQATRSASTRVFAATADEELVAG